MEGWDYSKRSRSEKEYIEWLRNNNASNDRKWIYTLIAWCIEHRYDKAMKINQHVNTIWHHNQGYFEKYKDEKEARKYHKKYYQEHSDSMKKRTKVYDKCVWKVWQLYRGGKLSEECTNRINTELDVFSKRLNIVGRCK